MSRKHSGGFISADVYWDIGTAERGRDGMNAREAAQRYNDHKHPPIEIEDDAEMLAWLNETQQASRPENSGSSERGGIIEDDASQNMRRAGDIASYNGLLWLYSPSGELVPLGVGTGCYVDASGQFVREIQYSSVQLATPTEVSTNDVPLVRPSGETLPVLGERVGSYTLDPSRFAMARAAPAMMIRATASLVPTIAATDHPDYETLIETFPHRATIRYRKLSATDLSGGRFSTEGFPEPLDFYSGVEIDPTVVSQVEISQPGTGQITVADTSALALNLDTLVFIEVYATVHVYTDDEVTSLDPTANADDVRTCTECVLDLMSITLEVEAALGLSPFINDAGTRYTRPKNT